MKQQSREVEVETEPYEIDAKDLPEDQQCNIEVTICSKGGGNYICTLPENHSHEYHIAHGIEGQSIVRWKKK